MPSGYAVNGTDLDDLFMARGTTTKRADVGYGVGGSDISNRFRAVKPDWETDKRSSNTGYKSNGTDLKEMFVDIDYELGPIIDTQPEDDSAISPASCSFTVTATAYLGDLSYQWQSWNGSGWDDISGANSATYNTTTGGTYRCKVWDEDGSTYAKYTDSVTATMYYPPSITSSPSNVTAAAGTGPHAIVCSASGSGTLLFTWYKWSGSDWTPYTSARTGNVDADTDQHVWNPIASGDAGTYRCGVGNAYGTAYSSSCTVTVT